MLLWFWQRNPSSGLTPWLMWPVNFLGFFLYLSGWLIETVGYVGQLLEMSLCFGLQVKWLYNFYILWNSVYTRMLAAFASIRKMKARHRYDFCQQSLVCVALWLKVGLDRRLGHTVVYLHPGSKCEPAHVSLPVLLRETELETRYFGSCSISVVQWHPDS